MLLDIDCEGTGKSNMTSIGQGQADVAYQTNSNCNFNSVCRIYCVAMSDCDKKETELHTLMKSE